MQQTIVPLCMFTVCRLLADTDAGVQWENICSANQNRQYVSMMQHTDYSITDKLSSSHISFSLILV